MSHVPFTQVQTSVIRDATLSRDARLLYAELLSYAWQDAMTFVGQERMAREMGCTTRSIYKWTKELEARGLIEVDVRLGKSNRYRVPVICEDPNPRIDAPDHPSTDVLATNTQLTNNQILSDAVSVEAGAW